MTMAVTPIEASCRHCGDDFHLYEVFDQPRGTCPRCGWILAPNGTAKLLEDAALADIAQRHLVGALRNLRDLPGNVLLQPHTVLRNLFEEVGWHKDLADDPETFRHELGAIRQLLAAWELLDPNVAGAQPRRTWLQRAVDWLRGQPRGLAERSTPSARAGKRRRPACPDDSDPYRDSIDDYDPRARPDSKVSAAA